MHFHFFGLVGYTVCLGFMGYSFEVWEYVGVVSAILGSKKGFLGFLLEIWTVINGGPKSLVFRGLGMKIMMQAAKRSRQS